jgi:hypothetical protein
VQRYELWQAADGHSFFPDYNHQAREMAAAEGQAFTWEVTAKGFDQAN